MLCMYTTFCKCEERRREKEKVEEYCERRMKERREARGGIYRAFGEQFFVFRISDIAKLESGEFLYTLEDVDLREDVEHLQRYAMQFWANFDPVGLSNNEYKK